MAQIPEIDSGRALVLDANIMLRGVLGSGCATDRGPGVENAALAELEVEAKRRIAARDPDDWPVIALAIAINAPVWTEDPDFFGSGVATWTTRNVEIYLSSGSQTVQKLWRAPRRNPLHNVSF